jgi:plastocyanin
MTRVLSSVVLLLALAAARTPASAPASGAVRGRVDVKAERTLRDARPDPGGLGMGSAPRDPQERRRSVVYLEEGPRGAFEQGETRRARMVQQNERFIPHVLAVVAGTWVDFPNADSTYHNVFSLSKTQHFDLGRYAAGKSQAVRFDNVGIVRVFCDIHSQMSAFILVFGHRFFTTTDDDGRYRIDGIPPGTYNVMVWNETLRGDPPKRPITIPEAGGDVEADFILR